jgi:hypothetical protein
MRQGRSRDPRAWPRFFAVCVSALTAAVGVPLLAHQTTVEVNTFLRAQGPVLTVLMRVPASILADAGLSTVKPGAFEQGANEAPLRAVALEAAKELDVMSGNRRLPASSAKWVVSRAGDSSFDSYETALEHLAGPSLPAAGEVYWNDVFVDLRLDYEIVSPDGLSVRFNGFRTPTGFVQTRVTYLPGDHLARQFTIIGPPRRVTLEPLRREAMPMFAKAGLRRLISDRALLLFLLVLAIPRRSLRTALRPFAAFLVGHVTSAIVMPALSSPPDVFVQLLFSLTATTALVIAALQNTVVTRIGWTTAVGWCFGLTNGVAVGLAVREALPLAGSHPVIGLAAFVGTTEIAALWLLIILQPVVQSLYRLGMREGVVTVALSLLPIHTGLHGIVESGQQLGATRLAVSNRAVGFAVGHWPAFVLALCFMILLAAHMVSRARTQAPRLT